MSTEIRRLLDVVQACKYWLPPDAYIDLKRAAESLVPLLQRERDINAALLASPPGQEAPLWQPIETCPQGIDFIIAAWPCAGATSGFDVGEAERDHGLITWRNLYGSCQPSHWMPLPASPSGLPPVDVQAESEADDRSFGTHIREAVNILTEPTLDQMVAELRAAGWIAMPRVIPAEQLWRSPAGMLYLGAAGAWRVMTAEAAPRKDRT